MEGNFGNATLADLDAKINYVVELIDGRQNDKKLLLLLAVLMSERDRMISHIDLMGRAREIARQHKGKAANAETGQRQSA